MKKLNLGCGHDILKGFVNVDVVKLPGVDKVVNLDKVPYDFKANTFDVVYCKHFLEHVTDIFDVLGEIHRILKPEGELHVIAPYFSGHGAFSDPQHKRFFTYKTFDYFTPNHYYTDYGYITKKRKIFFFSSKSFMKSKWFSAPIDFLINLAPVIYQRFFCWVFPSAEIHYVVKAKK